jgi:hypothetical protein
MNDMTLAAPDPMDAVSGVTLRPQVDGGSRATWLLVDDAGTGTWTALPEGLIAASIRVHTRTCI